jgi:hypothetical protein
MALPTELARQGDGFDVIGLAADEADQDVIVVAGNWLDQRRAILGGVLPKSREGGGVAGLKGDLKGRELRADGCVFGQ